MSQNIDPESTANLDELYQYRGDQLGCAYRGARLAFLNPFKILKSLIKPSFDRLQKFNRADRTP